MTETDRITSPANPRLKAAARLRDATDRRRRGLTLIDGLREVERAMAAGIAFDEVFLDESCPPSPSLIERLESAAGRPVWLAPAAFAKIAFGHRNEGLVVVARVVPAGLSGFAPREGRYLLIVEGVEKPGNLGAILRTADATGCGGVIVTDGGTDAFNPAVIRASLGTVFSVPLAAATLSETILWLAATSRRVVVAVPTSGQAWHAVPLADAAIVLGSEAHGISPAWQAAAAEGRLVVDVVTLPMRGVADSLNVSATAAVLAYEALRQAEAASAG
jgi:TrmH family RNA methyltransferase